MNEIIELSTLNLLKYGDHICLIYNSIKDYRTVAVNYIKSGLLNNDYVICIIDEYEETQLKQDLVANDINVNKFIEEGQLFISSISNTYRGASDFNPDNTLNYWRNKMDLLDKNRFSGIRVLGEATFALDGNYKTLDNLIEYEIRVNTEMIPYYYNYQFLCVYNKNLYQTHILEKIIKAHPIIINGQSIIMNNRIYKNQVQYLKEFKEDSCFLNNLDIHNKKMPINLEKNLKSDEERLRFILNGVTDGLWDWNIETGTVYFSDSMYELLGYGKEEL